MNQKRQLNLTINGNDYLVEVTDLHPSPLLVMVNGREYSVTINNQQLIIDKQTTAATDQPVNHSQSKIQNAITAPMPGNIIRIAVKTGEQVSKGQTLCHLEAMKMQNAIRSPRDGVIERIDVEEGTAVSHGDTLFTFSE